MSGRVALLSRAKSMMIHEKVLIRKIQSESSESLWKNRLFCHDRHHRRDHHHSNIIGNECYYYSSSAASAEVTGTTPASEASEASEAGKKGTKSQKLYMWGTSKHGTLPISSIVDHDDESAAQQQQQQVFNYPVQIDIQRAFGSIINEKDEDDVSISSINCGPSGTAVVFSNGSCMVAGSNKQGELGVGHKKDVPIPTPLVDTTTNNNTHTNNTTTTNSSPLPAMTAATTTGTGTGVSKICLGSNFSALIDTEGDLYTFGFGGSTLSGMGNLGHGDGQSYASPKLVESLIQDGCSVLDACLGELHMVVLTTEGEVLTAGTSSYGRLGNLDSDEDQLFLEPVELLGSEQIISICSGNAFTMALTKNDGRIYSWGRNDKGQLGTGHGLSIDMYSMESMPCLIEGQLEGRKVIRIAAGHSHAACITNEGELFVWGGGSGGGSGGGGSGSGQHSEPQLISSLLHTKCVDVYCGKDYTIVLDEHGKLYTFGISSSIIKTGVLGVNQKNNVMEPNLMENFGSSSMKYKILSLSTGWNHVACLIEEAEDNK